MPKDKTENIDRYKVRGGQFNDYQIQKDELALVQDDQDRAGVRLREGEWPEQGRPQDEAERIQRMMEEAREKVARKKAKLAGKGAAGKGATKKAAAKKGATRKGAAKPAAKKAAKKSAAKKGAGKKSTKARG